MSTNINADKKKGFRLTFLNNEQSPEEKKKSGSAELQFDSDIPEGQRKNSPPAKPAANEFGARNFSTQSPQREPDWVRQSKGVNTPASPQVGIWT